MTRYVPKCKDNKKKHDNRTNRCKPKPPKVRRVRDIIGNIRKRLAKIESENVEPIVIPRQFTYGLVEVGTDVIFREIDKGNRLNIVYAVSSGFQDDVVAFILDDVVVYPDQISSNGEINHSVFAPGGASKARLIFQRGGTFQKPVPVLVENTSVDNSFVGTGICYVVGRFIYDEEIFKGGDPTLRVILRGKVCRDPRKSENQWTINPYVHLYDMLLSDRIYGGMGLSTGDLDLPSWIEACNFAEEVLDTPNISFDIIGTDSSYDVFSFEYPINPLQYGDIVTFSGDLPSTINAGQEYHIIMMKHVVNDISITKIRIATSFDKAMKNEYILTGLNTKDFKVHKVKEIRFSSAGSYRGRLDVSVLDEWLQSCSSHFTFRDGKLGIVIPKFPTTEKILTAGDLVDSLSISTKLDFDDRTTSMTGIFVGSPNLFREDDYPTVGGSQFEAIDKGEFPRRFDLPKAAKATVAQRVAQIEFAKRRQEGEISFPTDIEHWDLVSGSIIRFDFEESQIKENETFQITSRNLVLEIENEAPVFKLDFTARELDNNTFDFGLTNQQIVEIGRFPAIVDSRNVLPPGKPNIDEELFSTVDGSGLRIKATISWASSGDLFLQGYLLGYKRTAETVYTYLPISPDTSRVIFDLAPDVYDFQVQTVNTLNFKSAKITSFNVKILGPYATPSNVLNFRGQPTGSSILFTWDKVPDLDVRIGGRYEIWWHVDPNGGQENFALKIAEVTGELNTKTLPFMRGTYYIRAVDQVGLKGDFSEFSTERVAPVQFAQFVTSEGQFDPSDLVLDEATIQEEPFWASTNINNTVDVVGDIIRLPTTGSIDAAATPTGWVDIPQFDAVGQIAPDGVYYFTSGVTFDRVIKFRCEAIIEFNLQDLFVTSFDSRPGNVDSFLSWDTVAAPGSAEAWIECRVTRDDPSIPGSWSEWQRLYTQDFYHRAIEWRIILKSYDFQANVEVTRARIYMRELFEPGATVSSSPFQVTTPRVGASTPKEAAFTPSVVRIGVGFPANPTSALLLRMQKETTIVVSIDRLVLLAYQANSSPWSGSGASTVLATDFDVVNAEQDLLQSVGLHSQHIQFFFSPAHSDAYSTASPATSSSNFEDRAIAHFKAFVSAYGPLQGQGRGDLISYNDVLLANEVINFSESDLVNNSGPFKASYGTNWFIKVIGLARQYFPRTAKLGWAETNVIQGFSPTPEADGTSGAAQDANSGAVLTGYTNRIEDSVSRYFIIRYILDAMDLGLDFIPDLVAIQCHVWGRSGATPILRARYLDKPGIHDFVVMLSNLGVRPVIGRMRLGWSTGDGGTINTIDDNDADTCQELIEVFVNNSICDKVVCWTGDTSAPYITVYDEVTGIPVTAAGSNTVDFYNAVLDGASNLIPVSERIIPKFWSHEFTDVRSAGMRPIIWTSGPTSANGSYSRRAGFVIDTNSTEIGYIQISDVEKFGIDFDKFTLVMDVFVSTTGCESRSFALFFSTGTAILNGMTLFRRPNDHRLCINVFKNATWDTSAWNTPTGTPPLGPNRGDLATGSILPGGVEQVIFNDQFRANAAGSVAFPSDAAGGGGDPIVFTDALNRSTRIVLSFDRELGRIKWSVNGNSAESVFTTGPLPTFNRIYLGSPPFIDGTTFTINDGNTSRNNRFRHRIRRIKIVNGVMSNEWMEQVSNAVWGTIEPKENI